jgi:hypothetical protein
LRWWAWPGNVRIEGWGKREDLPELVQGGDGEEGAVNSSSSSLPFSNILDDFFPKVLYFQLFVKIANHITSGFRSHPTLRKALAMLSLRLMD